MAYKCPNNLGKQGAYRSLSKSGFKTALSNGTYNPEIILYDEKGKQAEVWSLNNAFITSIDWGGSLDYTSDDMLELTIEVSFDWATRVKGNPP